MTVYRTRGGTIQGQKMPSYSTLICDAPDCGTTPRQGDDAKVLRRAAKGMGWVRSSDGRDYCSVHRHFLGHWAVQSIRAVRATELRDAADELSHRGYRSAVTRLRERADRIESGEEE